MIVSSVTTSFINSLGNSDIVDVFCKVILELICTLVVVFLIGISKQERSLICTYIRKRIGL